MNYDWIHDFCLSLKGCTYDFKEEWGAGRYMLKGKMFAMRGDDNNNRPIITVKLEPSYGELLRKTYENIVPGYYMNKVHWNSIYLDSDVDAELIKELLMLSHEILLESLPKKLQKEILEA